MIIEESIAIQAPVEGIWNAFTDLIGWREWNSVLENVTRSKRPIISQGDVYTFCIRPFGVPICFDVAVKELSEHKKIVWSGRKYGITSRHEFVFSGNAGNTRLTSRETFEGPTMATFRLLFPRWKIRAMTISLLEDLKKYSEKSGKACRYPAGASPDRAALRLDDVAER
jgi:hypothetical protein